MTDILRLENLDFHTVFFGIFIIMASIIAIYKLIGEFSKMVGKPVKWVKDQDKGLKEMLELERRQKDMETSLKDLQDKLTQLTEIVVDDRIDRMRYEILDMASAISEAKRWYSVEQLEHAIQTYDEYEKFLKAHGKTNGAVDISIEIIKTAYAEKYKGMKK